jgi:hypothetical protein
MNLIRLAAIALGSMSLVACQAANYPLFDFTPRNPPAVTSTVSFGDATVVVDLKITNVPDDLIGLVAYGKKEDYPAEDDQLFSIEYRPGMGSTWNPNAVTTAEPNYGYNYWLVVDLHVAGRDGLEVLRYEYEFINGNELELQLVPNPILFSTASVTRVSATEDRVKVQVNVRGVLNTGSASVKSITVYSGKDVAPFVIKPAMRKGSIAFTTGDGWKGWIVAEVVVRKRDGHGNPVDQVLHFRSLNDERTQGRVRMQRVP